MPTLEELVFLYFKGEYEEMITFINKLGMLTGLSIEPFVRELDKITHEKY